MTNLTKAGIAITGIGTLGGGAALANNLLGKEVATSTSTSKKVSDQLTDEGFELNNDDAIWKTVLEAHNKLTKSDNVFDFSRDDERTESWLKEKCNSLLTKESIDNENYKKARQWCVKEKTINDVLVKGKRKVLKTNNEDDKNEWTKKAKDLKNNSQAAQSLSVEISSKDDNTIAGKLKEACGKLNISTVKTTDKGFNDTFEKAKEWCSINQ